MKPIDPSAAVNPYGHGAAPTPVPSMPAPVMPTPTPAPAATPAAAARPAPIAGDQYANFVMTFDDEFQSIDSISVGDTFNGAKWYNGTEQCCMVDSTGLPGAMFPTAVNGVSYNPYQILPGGGLDIQLVKQNNVWYSGVLTSVDKNKVGFKQQYGYFEMMAQMPGGDGVWPAFWLLSTDPNMPGEIDIMEYYGHDQGRTFGITLHDWRSSGAQTLPGSHFPQVSGMTMGMHKYAMLWDAQMMHFYFDDQEVWSTPTPAVMNNPYYLLINDGLGGYWPTADTPAVNDFKIQYVRAYGPK